MEEYIEARRPTCSAVSGVRSVDNDDDSYEGDLKVPNSVLNECRDSFFAADEKKQNASTSHFADTGLMAMLCRHTRVLWLINMTSAGEKQFYALALICKLFQHLPTQTKVGLLYDIGCQTHRSFVKWKLLPEYIQRIIFGLSVFHAYGHNWACQLVYHPRKRVGFGLTDGERCERFWSSIKKLIPTLRVSGVRIFFTTVSPFTNVFGSTTNVWRYWRHK